MRSLNSEKKTEKYILVKGFEITNNFTLCKSPAGKFRQEISQVGGWLGSKVPSNFHYAKHSR
jgi:hypothetical protein